MKSKFILLLALVFGFTAAFGTYRYMEDLKKTYMTKGNFVPVATAKQKIAARTIISGDMLEFKEMPAQYVVPGTIMDIKDAVGKMARGDIYPGELILSDKLVARDDPGAGLSAKITKGKRAVSIPVNNITALHGLINTGDHVDVMVTFNAPGEQKTPVTSTIIQNVPVLAVNRAMDSGVPAKEELQTITLMVEPEQAQQIALAIQQGSVQLALRSPEDSDVLPVPTSKLGHLMR
jgi:pilus assembly protein CpaB